MRSHSKLGASFGSGAGAEGARARGQKRKQAGSGGEPRTIEVGLGYGLSSKHGSGPHLTRPSPLPHHRRLRDHVHSSSATL